MADDDINSVVSRRLDSKELSQIQLPRSVSAPQSLPAADLDMDELTSVVSGASRRHPKVVSSSLLRCP